MSTTSDDDDHRLEVLGYKPTFRREFSNLATISFAFSIMVCSVCSLGPILLQIQITGIVFEYRNDSQHSTVTWRACFRMSRD